MSATIAPPNKSAITAGGVPGKARTSAIKASPPASDWVARLRPSWILLFLVVELIALLLLFAAYLAGWWGLNRVPSIIAAGIMPLVVPWGGALGGVCVAIAGITDHWRSFGPHQPSTQSSTWNAWYLIRLPMGAVFGTVGALIVVLFLKTIGESKGGAIDVSPTGCAILFVIAFVVGFKQDVFRQLVSRVVTVLLGPGGDGNPAVGTAPGNFSIALAQPFGAVAVKSSSTGTVTITNNGRTPMAIPSGAISIDNAAYTVKTAFPSSIAAGETGSAQIEFQPVKAGAASGHLTVTIAGTPHAVALTGEGV